MHEKTRRWFCRIAFLGVCLVPTVSLLGVIGYRQSPLFARRQIATWERAVREHSGFLAQIGSVSYPRGDVALLGGIKLTDPDSQRLVLQVRQAEIVRTKVRLLVILSQPEVEPGQFLRLCEAFHDRLLRGGAFPAVQARALELTLQGSPRALTFTDVQCSLVPDVHTARTVLDFRVAGIEMPAPARIEIVRNRGVWPPTTGWEVRTGPVPLPCSLLTGYFESLERLGPDCRFAGKAWAEQSSDGWNGGLTGQFHAVALDQVIEPFPHKLSGTAQVMLEHLKFRGGRLYEAAGIVDCGGGVVSRPLLTRLADAYRCEKSPLLEQAESALIEFEQLAVRFELGDEGLQLRGLCSDGAPGVLITDHRGPLVMEAETRPQPAMALAQALSPENALQVPATTESDLLLRALPLPRQTPDAPRTAERSGYAPIRFRE